ncbi:VOC family protein [Bacillus methanolicus]|uniref:VOC family protein n=1 Tax=Bacillus methanolicus TaxID=1471 RepID=UPI00237FD9C8|nr:VOC family protein [Bacillus methanolicus]MDE3838936.1 VOC family protein [Bacillus methanolicus]
MKLELDHVVHFLNRHPLEAVKLLKNHGYHAVMGGRHEHWGTHNSLFYNGLSYVEFLAIEDRQKANEADNPLVQQLINDIGKGEGVGQICLRTDNISVLQSTIRKRGFNTSDIFDGSRKREDGSVIRWKMLFILEKTFMPFPFFIEWEQTDEERLHDLKKLRMITEDQENRSIKSVTYTVHNAEKAAKEWSKLFDVPILDITDSEDKTASVQVGELEVVFVQPATKESDLYKVLHQRGERPFLVTFEPKLQKQGFELFGTRYQ